MGPGMVRIGSRGKSAGVESKDGLKSARRSGHRPHRIKGHQIGGFAWGAQDLAGQDLAGQDLAGQDLAGQDLAGERLRGKATLDPCHEPTSEQVANVESTPTGPNRAVNKRSGKGTPPFPLLAARGEPHPSPAVIV
ncbi:hypothetical protein DB459_18635 [Bradyrhizobium sp. WD16]|nr:hypothetical protein DB459_18635 [Bradyrhizobium sp. WD16]